MIRSSPSASFTVDSCVVGNENASFTRGVSAGRGGGGGGGASASIGSSAAAAAAGEDRTVADDEADVDEVALLEGAHLPHVGQRHVALALLLLPRALRLSLLLAPRLQLGLLRLVAHLALDGALGPRDQHCHQLVDRLSREEREGGAASG